MDKVDFGLRKATSSQPQASKDVVDEVVYFYSDLPSTSFVLPTPWDRRFSLGSSIKHWLITSKQEEIDYIRENFSPKAVAEMGRDASSVIIYEKTKEEYDQYLGLGVHIQEEHNPMLEEAKRQAQLAAGINPQEHPDSPPLSKEHMPAFEGALHPTLQERLEQQEQLAKE